MQDLHSDDNDEDSEDDDDNDMDSDVERPAHTHLAHHPRRLVNELAGWLTCATSIRLMKPQIQAAGYRTEKLQTLKYTLAVACVVYSMEWMFAYSYKQRGEFVVKTSPSLSQGSDLHTVQDSG